MVPPEMLKLMIAFLAAVVLPAVCNCIASCSAANSNDLLTTLVTPDCPTTLHVTTPPSDAIKSKYATRQQLIEEGPSGAVVAAQLAPAMAADGAPANDQYCLLATIPPTKNGIQSRRFHLEAAPQEDPAESGFKFTDLHGTSLRLCDGNRPVLVYNYDRIANSHVDEADCPRSRACYVHPVWGIGGEVLTDDFPKDHYHHRGIFWAWPHVGIDGQEYDLWTHSNIESRFVRWLFRQTGSVAAVVAVENGWFVGQKKVMIERVWLRVHQVVNDSRMLEFDFAWIPVDKPITLRGAEEKSYGGLAMRFATRSGKDAVITVPNGRPKDDLPETPLPWADLTCPFGGASASSGAALFVAPNHPDYPPTWLTRHYGILCIGWPGAKARTFEPGKPIRLSYCVWIHMGAAEVNDLKRVYDAYAASATIHWE